MFIGLSAFRDGVRCGHTIYDAFEKAKHPELISIGVVEQIIADQDAHCVDTYCAEYRKKHNTDTCPHMDRISVIEVDAYDAKGPMVARAQQGTLIQDEEFCLQVDGHSEFNENWDADLYTMWRQTQNEYAVLSTYINHVGNMRKESPNGEVPMLCNLMWGQHNMVRLEGAAAASCMSRPKLSPLWGAGLSFSKCHAETAVPVDKYGEYIFDGEEFSRAARLWTHGYDFYTPNRNVVFHNYTAPHRDPPANGKPNPKNLNGPTVKKAVNRLKHWLGIPYEGEADLREIEMYGAGPQRTLDQFAEWTGIDLKNKDIKNGRCHSLEYVSYVRPPSRSRRDNVDHRALEEAQLAAAYDRVRLRRAEVYEHSDPALEIASIKGELRTARETIDFLSGQPPQQAAVGAANGQHNRPNPPANTNGYSSWEENISAQLWLGLAAVSLASSLFMAATGRGPCSRKGKSFNELKNSKSLA